MNRNRTGIAFRIMDTLLWCLLCVLLTAGFSKVRALERYVSVSLRYDTPLSGQAAYNARKYSVERAGEDMFWPTFWRESNMPFSSEFVTANMDCISFSGDAVLVWPAAYLAGAAPGVLDNHGCAVSSALAWRLWGSLDVVGMTILADGEKRVVRGVFEGERELALLSFRDEDTTQDWSAVELTGGSTYATRGDAESYAIASGLGKPDAVLMGGSLLFLARAMAVLPLFILTGYIVAIIINLLRKHFQVWFRLCVFLLLIGFAICLPSLLNVLPFWLIPTRWSDFSFWPSLLRKWSDSLMALLGMAPGKRDVAVKLLLLSQAGLCFAAVLCAHWKLSVLYSRLSACVPYYKCQTGSCAR